MKKTIVFAISLIMALTLTLTLAACGGNTPPPSSNTPIPTPTDNSQPSETPTPEAAPDPTPSISDADIPDNGTPPDISQSVNGLMESHRGDKGYFYVNTDDYLVYVREARANVFDSETYGTVYQYEVGAYNEDGSVNWSSIMIKYVFESNEKASQYAATRDGDAIAIDNAIYFTIQLNVQGWPSKDRLDTSSDGSSSDLWVDYYISMP